MGIIVSNLLLAVAGFLAILVAVLLVEVLAATARPRRDEATPRSTVRPRIAVLVPAHNESKGLLPTLADVKSQLHPRDRLLVVADNCSDDTAAVARAAGAEVVERNDPSRRGKGFALDHGIAHLAADPPDVVVMIDADCRVAQGAIGSLAVACAASNRPVQGLDLMTAAAGSPVSTQVAEFAWRVKNWVRPLGLRNLGLPCLLVGTGMAFPWHLIRSADLANASLVEDLKLGLELARSGTPPMFCPSARVVSEFPISAAGAQSQRQRWEQGYITTIAGMAPRLLGQAIARADLCLLALALDLLVPPLSLLTLLVVATFVLAALAALSGLSAAALAVSTASLAGLAAAVALAWWNWGRDALPASALLSITPYVLCKLGLYRRILFGRTTAQWTRTERSLTDNRR